MEDSIEQKKFNWPAGGLNCPTKFRLHYPPSQPIYTLPKGRKTEAWHNWHSAMMMDSRFSGTERSIITALAKHYNLTTGECFPSHGRVAVEAGLGATETGKKAVQRAVSNATRLGWIKRTLRRGGSRQKSQTNTYELTLPQSIRDAINNVGPRLAVTVGRPGTWNVTQTTDGVAICGPSAERENAVRWIAEHGPTGQIGIATGQNGGGDRTLDPPITVKSKNREVKEPSVSSIQVCSLREHTTSKNLSEGREERKGEFEGEYVSPSRIPNEEPWRGYIDDEVWRVRDIISDYNVDTIGGIMACARTFGDINYITGNVIAAMCRDGHFDRDGDRIFLLDENEED